MRMRKKYYISTSFLNIEQAREVNLMLGNTGMFVSSENWFDEPFKTNQEEMAVADFNGVENAEFLVFLMPGRLGTHVELGIALQRKIPIFVLNTAEVTDECVFYSHPWFKLHAVTTTLHGLLAKIVRDA